MRRGRFDGVKIDAAGADVDFFRERAILEAGKRKQQKNNGMEKKFSPFSPSEGLKVISACPLCHVHYNPLQAHVIDQRADAHLLHLECQNCGSGVVAAVLNDQLGISSFGLLTDLSSDDTLRCKDDPSPVTTDDVLGLHSLLAGIDHRALIFSN